MKNIKLYLLTGFLGSGKTTFLQNVLHELDEKKVAVIMNEFGKTGIDGEIIRQNKIELKEINRGSIFCSCLQLSFVEALIEMSKKDIEYLFVESSGLADPSNIGKFLEAVEANIGQAYNYSGAITLIDGKNFLEEVKEIETVTRQLKFSHLAVISKIDLITDEEKDAVKKKVQSINNKAIIAEANNGKLNFDFLNYYLVKDEWLGDADTTNSPDNKPKTLTLSYNGDVEKNKFVDFINAIIDDAFRMKGFFKINGKWNQVDVVSKSIDFKEISKTYDQSQLVIISKIGPKIIKPIFEEFTKHISNEFTVR